MSDSVPLVIYHGGCDDGFGAAWAIWTLHPDWEFVGAEHGDDPPAVTGREVFLVDFSYQRPVLDALARSALSITVIDHHESAERALAAPFDAPGSCPVDVVFDRDHSAAVLTWRVFYPGESVPDLLRYIEDRDLWRKLLPYCDEVIFALRAYPQDFKVWNTLMDSPWKHLRYEGRPIKRWFDRQVAVQVDRWRHAPVFAEVGGVRVPVMNTTVQFCSELAQALAEAHPFAAVFWHTSRGVTYSLRSRNPDGTNVAMVAERYGGGGHAHAAGFRVDRPLAMVRG